MKKWLGRIVIGGIGVALLLLIIARVFSIHIQKIYRYDQQVGYLPPSNKDYHPTFTRCSDFPPYGSYSSYRTLYAKDKGAFKQYITSKFNRNGYTDNGLLNLRFLMNCKGDIGDLEINELDNNFNRKDLTDELVAELLALSFEDSHWTIPSDNPANDYYMYLIFRIENGKVTEILP